VLASYHDHERSPLITRADRIVRTTGRPAVTDSSALLSEEDQGGSNEHAASFRTALSRP
jgi:hypothetical protein